jgi:hypothetical protein
MHYIRVMTSHKTSPEGEQWVTHSFKEEELSEMYARIRGWESRNIPFEYQYADSAGSLVWSLASEKSAEEEMAEEADNYDPEGEWF